MLVTSLLPAAVLWDLDGTLIDSEPFWLTAERSLVAEYGVEWTDVDGLSLVGKGLMDSGRYLQSRGVDMDPADIVDRLVTEVRLLLQNDIPWRPGALDLLRSVHDAGIPQVLVTMSYRSLADIVVNDLGFLAASITGDEVTHSKPHPEPYHLGAAAVQANIRHCVAFEDSKPGVASATASGATTIAVPLHVPLPENPTEYDTWHTLVGRTVVDIAAVYTQRTTR
ncbi:HAD superfamily hydrolase (TIGR01509 family) [Microbacteriaceae bacterium MWH-Ta3]|nr:HAD superfamily hydrolase (TIGR01509 family) [Microbacteriaceae bacterium MWH-Ta3]